MRMLLIAAAIVASAAFAGAQNRQPPPAIYGLGASVSMQVKQGETRGTEMYVKGLTLTIGEIVITADEATLDRNGEFRLGSNARVRVPLK